VYSVAVLSYVNRCLLRVLAHDEAHLSWVENRLHGRFKSIHVSNHILISTMTGLFTHISRDVSRCHRRCRISLRQPKYPAVLH
jgi:hypothetical protein